MHLRLLFAVLQAVRGQLLRWGRLLRRLRVRQTKNQAWRHALSLRVGLCWIWSVRELGRLESRRLGSLTAMSGRWRTGMLRSRRVPVQNLHQRHLRPRLGLRMARTQPRELHGQLHPGNLLLHPRHRARRRHPAQNHYISYCGLQDARKDCSADTECQSGWCLDLFDIRRKQCAPGKRMGSSLLNELRMSLGSMCVHQGQHGARVHASTGGGGGAASARRVVAACVDRLVVRSQRLAARASTQWIAPPALA